LTAVDLLGRLGALIAVDMHSVTWKERS